MVVVLVIGLLILASLVMLKLEIRIVPSADTKQSTQIVVVVTATPQPTVATETPDATSTALPLPSPTPANTCLMRARAGNVAGVYDWNKTVMLDTISGDETIRINGLTNINGVMHAITMEGNVLVYDFLEDINGFDLCLVIPTLDYAPR